MAGNYQETVLGVIVSLLMFLVGIALLMSGLQQRREDGRGDGLAKISIGGALLAGLCLSIAVSAISSGSDRPTAQGRTNEETPQDIVLALHGADKYLRSIDQVRLTSKDKDGGRVDMTYAEEDAVGTITSGDTTIRLIRLGGDTFINPSDTFWTNNGSPEAIDVVDGRWIRIDADDPDFAQLAALGDRERLREMLTGAREYTPGEPMTIRGVDCRAVKSSPDGAVLYLALDRSRLLHFDDGAGGVGDLDYDAPTVTPKAPSRVVEGSEIFE